VLSEGGPTGFLEERNASGDVSIINRTVPRTIIEKLTKMREDKSFNGIPSKGYLISMYQHQENRWIVHH
jgi:hypothetical protein